jgi:flagellar hook protein FlgE
MSIYTAMRAGVSGLNSNSAAMAVISDNIANVNTTAYKRGQSDFSSIINSQGIAGGYNAGGVTINTRRLVDQQGSLEKTRSATDLGISGNGFFVVTEDAESSAGAGGGLFTRSGAFSLDKSGRMVNSQGLYLLGAPIDPNSPRNIAPSTLAALEPIDLSSVGSSATPTANVTISANLDARTNSVPAYTVGDLTNQVQPPHLERAVEVYDSLGAVRTLNLAFLKTSTPLNRWAVEIYHNNPTTGVRERLADGYMRFGTDGKPIVDNPGFPQITGLTIDWTSIAPPDPATAGTGAADQTINFDLVSSMTQYAVASGLNSATADGSPPGDLIGVNVNREGVLTAQFSNGRIDALYLIPVATFLNPNGLDVANRGAFRQTIESGLLTINTAGASGAGTIQANSLEASNVDLGTEFTNMITTQRAYSASSRVITTADEMLEELIRIKR